MSNKGDSSALMSKLLLQRWKMLAAPCGIEGCHNPLMENPENQQPYCVVHGYEISNPEKATIDANLDTVKSSESALSVTRAGSDDEKNSSTKILSSQAPNTRDAESTKLAKRKQSDVAGEKIGKFLLQGWTLVDNTCQNPECIGVPLVRDADMVEKCVICDTSYMTEANYKKYYGHLQQQSQTQIIESTTSKEQQTKNISEIANKPIPLDSNGKIDSTVERFYPSDHEENYVCHEKNKIFKKSNISQNTSIFAKEALNKKIVELLEVLDGTNDIKSIPDILSAIQYCAKTIELFPNSQ